MIDLGSNLVLPDATSATRYLTDKAWHRKRRQHITSSDTARILGLSPKGSTWDTYCSKRGIERKISTALLKLFRRGHREEPRILEDYCEETGNRVVGPLGRVMIEGPAPLCVTPDSFVHARQLGWGVGEVKTDRDPWAWGGSGVVIEQWTAEAAEIVREDYACQLYTQLAATGLSWGVLIVRLSMDDLRWYVLMADPVIQGEILKRSRDWFERFVVGDEVPSIDASDACWDALARLWPVHDDKVVREATDDEIELATTIERIGRLKREDLPIARNMLSNAMGDADCVTWPSMKPGRKNKAQRQRTAHGGATIRVYLQEG